jgi:riboflavin kinase / FMN adenylyltransferase
MEIIKELPEYFRKGSPVVTIGNFDGVHIGHQKIFRAVADKAHEIKGKAIAITFDPHPVKVLLPDRGLKMITTPEAKAGLIFGSGITDIVSIDFNRDFAQTEAEDFINDIIAGLLKARRVIVGHNYTFGRGKKGNAKLLRKYGKKFGFDVTVVRYATLNGEIVSSSRVRRALANGKVSEAAKMLGRAYHIEGTVITGAGRGAKLLDTPTANIAAENELIPKEGVYAVRVSIRDAVYDGVANLGNNPTFKGGVLSYEVHLLDFHRNLVGKRMRVHFITRLRDEKKFDCVEGLYNQIRKDIDAARKCLVKKDFPLYL